MFAVRVNQLFIVFESENKTKQPKSFATLNARKGNLYLTEVYGR